MEEHTASICLNLNLPLSTSSSSIYFSADFIVSFFPLQWNIISLCIYTTLKNYTFSLWISRLLLFLSYGEQRQDEHGYTGMSLSRNGKAEPYGSSILSFMRNLYPY